MLASLRHCLSRLLTFRGRTSRAEFWPYIAVTAGLWMLLAMAAMMPAMIASIARMRQFAAAHPDQATVTQGLGSYSITIQGHHPELMPDIGAFTAVIVIGSAVLVGLYAAATVRRLHDAGRAGWLALMPLPFLTTAMVMTPRLLGDFGGSAGPDMGLFALLFVNNILYLATLALLVVKLVRPSSREWPRS